MIRSLLTIATVLVAADAQAQTFFPQQNCPDGNCPQVQPSVIYRTVPATPAKHGWYDEPGLPWIKLYVDGRDVGKLNLDTREWLTTGKAKAVDLPSVFLPAKPIERKPEPKAEHPAIVGGLLALADAKDDPKPESDDPLPGGVVTDKIPQDETYTHRGKLCCKNHAFEALQSTLPDDRSKWFLTIVGDEPMRKQVLRDLEIDPGLAVLRPRLHVNAYDPKAWHVSQVGLQPGITLQQPPDATGRSAVQWRFRTYAGPLALAEAIRKADPNYQPATDPDPAKPAPAPTPAPTPPSPVTPAASSNLILVLIAAAIGLYFYFQRKGKIS